MGRRWHVATLGGVPINVTPGWLVFVGLIVWFTYTTAIDQGFPVGEAAALSALATVLFFGGVAVHEAAHAVVARSFDLPVFGVTFVFWGGYTETPAGAKGALRQFAVAIVGPLSTLLIAVVLFAVAGATSGSTSMTVENLAWLNLFFAGVNAIPAMPLDGGQALTAAIRGITGSRRTAERVTGYISLGVGAALVVGGFISFRGDGQWALPMLFIGFQMIMIGRGTEQRAALRDKLAHARVADAMRPPPDAIPANMSLTEALDRHLRETKDRYFPVVDGESLVGTISLRTAGSLGSKDPLRPVRDAMLPLERSATVAPDLPLEEALELLAGRDGMVLRDGRLVGALGPADIDAWLQYGGRRQQPVGGQAPSDPPPRPDL